MSRITRGSCNCGAVKWEAEGALRGILACHCGQCRKQTGSYYAATNVEDEQLTVTGEENITWYHASPVAKRGFCRNCGSALFWKPNDSDYTSILVSDLPIVYSVPIYLR